ncbi:MAG: Microtubule-associated protein, microtubule dynamics during spindle orientation [Geoglossum simile]|nr:MAG: Microtubule-associated protein, microtubule dynamics during spindle orientation [Geoglossum simile]
MLSTPIRKLTRRLSEIFTPSKTKAHQLPPKMADQEEDFSSLPLPDRFSHKVWKVRKQAYEDAAKQFEVTPDESDPAFTPFLQDPNLWKSAVADSNVAAQQEGITALCSFLKYGGRQACTRTRNLTISPIVEKGLSSTRAAAKSKALEALLLYIELDVPGPIIEDLIPFLSHKQPKIIAAALSALTSIYNAYGCKTVDPKPVLKLLPKVFGHADKNVRAESQGLAVEFYRWLREAMKPMFWGELKPVQQQDLESLFEKTKQEPAPKQERYLRSQQAAMAATAAAGEEEAGVEVEEEVVEIDAFDLAEPVDVSSKVPKDFHENVSSTKWKDRKDALDALYAVLNVPRIKDADFGEIIRSLAKCMKDANIAVVTVAANCVDVLAKGLRKGFPRYRSVIMTPIMDRLKEKKQSVADALGQALDSVFTATSLTDCLEETLEYLKHKNPQVKLETLRFLIRCLRATREVPHKPEVKSIADAATKQLTDSSEVVRSGAAEILGTLMKIMGERAMNPYLDGLDEIRKTRIKEYFETAEVKAKDKPKPPPAPVAAHKAAPGRKVMGKRPAPGQKKPAPRAPTPVEEPAPAPPQPKPTGKNAPPRLGAQPKSGLAQPGAGLKLQKRLTGPGGAAAPNVSSPRRPVSHPPPPQEEEVAPPPAPKFGLTGRGLAGRPLGKPPPAVSAVEPVSNSSVIAAGMSAIERAELEELRAEKERLQRTNEDLRAERSKLNSQIHELQNQNAQLIEDHTRDVLSIKAKETQLVRARSDHEAAEQMVHKQQREMERLKRELSRAVRATSPAPADVSEQIYRDAGMNGAGRYDSAGYTGGYGRQGTKRLSFASSMSEEKENGGLDAATYRGKLSPPLSAGLSSGTATGGRGSPTPARDGGGGAAGDGIESWKRAAEVTSQLKARIEQMKV